MNRSPVINSLTIDVEDYFMVSAFEAFVPKEKWDSMESRVEPATRKIVDMLKEFEVHATFFVVGWVAERYPQLVRDIAAAGHEIGCHSYYHRLVYTLSPEEFRKDTQLCKQALGKIVSTPLSGYRAPSFSLTAQSKWMLDILHEEGFTYDSSALPAKHARGGVQDPGLAGRFPYRVNGLIELPMTTLRLCGQNMPFSGGGYFRLFPYTWIKAGLSSLNRQGQPAVVYLHPWEFDPDQPRIPVRGLDRFRHYVNLDKTEEKFRRLLSDFSFAPARKVLESAF